MARRLVRPPMDTRGSFSWLVRLGPLNRVHSHHGLIVLGSVQIHPLSIGAIRNHESNLKSSRWSVMCSQAWKSCPISLPVCSAHWSAHKLEHSDREASPELEVVIFNRRWVEKAKWTYDLFFVPQNDEVGVLRKAKFPSGQPTLLTSVELIQVAVWGRNPLLCMMSIGEVLNLRSIRLRGDRKLFHAPMAPAHLAMRVPFSTWPLIGSHSTLDCCLSRSTSCQGLCRDETHGRQCWEFCLPNERNE